jgi:hypothetical protein
MFEKAFLPFLRERWSGGSLVDPIDECMIHCFSKAAEAFRYLKVF